MQTNRSESSLCQLIFFTFSVISIMVIGASGCGFPRSASSSSHNRETTFQDMIEVPTEYEIHLFTDKNRYSRGDEIGIWVENKTNYTLRFRDQSLGLQVYQYDEQAENWQSVDLGFTLADPRVIIVTPGPRSALPNFFFSMEGSTVHGKIRLVITGTTDQGQPFAAYKDIEIVD